MLIIPAIDLQAGRCVRLKQGQFNKVTSFEYPPLDRAASYAEMGAKRVHIVDLDGAQTGTMQQLSLISSMCNTGIAIQAGGGIRSLEQARLCRASGITKIVLGSIAVTQPELTVQIVKEIGARHIVLALDVRMDANIPKPATHGWQTPGNLTLWEVISYYQEIGLNQILCTDIACDGMMEGPNFKLYQAVLKRFPDISLQASGGIRHQQDLASLKSSGVSAAILGLTLYQENFNLTHCLKEYEKC